MTRNVFVTPITKGITLFLFLLLSACATGTTPAQKVYGIQSQYNAGLVIAVAYKNLPECVPGLKVCKKASVVKVIQDADNIAFPALETAQIAVRTGTLDVAQASVIAADVAVKAFTAITSRLVTQ